MSNKLKMDLVDQDGNIYSNNSSQSAEKRNAYER